MQHLKEFSDLGPTTLSFSCVLATMMLPIEYEILAIIIFNVSVVLYNFRSTVSKVARSN